MLRSFFLFLFVFHLSSSQAEELVPFETDYCTGYPEGTWDHPDLWKHCCLEHDLYFWAGGSKEDRRSSDFILKECVEETGENFQALIIYIAVSAGSYSPIKFSNKKWNYGWTQRTSLKSLSVEDIDRIDSEILKEEYNFIPLPLKEKFLQELRSR